MIGKIGMSLLAAGVLSGTGCQHQPVSAALSMGAGDEARVEVFGSSPYVEIRNAGPGPVWVDVHHRPGGEGQMLSAGNMIGRGTSHGPIAIRVKVEDGLAATVELRAQKSRGLELDGPKPSSMFRDWDPDF